MPKVTVFLSSSLAERVRQSAAGGDGTPGRPSFHRLVRAIDKTPRAEIEACKLSASQYAGGKRIALNLGDDLHRSLRLIALRRNCSLSRLVGAVIDKKLAEAPTQ
jgi:hypothetical protein